MGALTSKPYAFNARPWELQRFNGVDFLDGFGSSIYVDVRGTRIVRVTPRINEDLNEEWITDKIRFFYDGIARQRIGFPMFSDRLKSTKTFIKLSWTQALNILKSKIIDNYSSINILLGSLLDITSIFGIKNTINNILDNYSINFYSNFTLPITELDFRSSYVFKSLSYNFENIEKVILIGCMPRLESPLFNLKLIRFSKRLNFSLYSIGATPNIGYGLNIKSLGLNIGKVIRDLSWGKLKLSNLLCFSKSSLFVLGSQIFQSNHNFTRVVKSLLTRIILELNHNTKSFLFYLYPTQSIPNMSELGILSNDLSSSKINKNLLINVLEEDVRYNKDSFSFVTSIMCNGESNTMNSDLILPSAHPFEFRSAYVNNFGVLDVNKIYSIKPFMESKPVSEIFYLLKNIYGKKLILLSQFFDVLVFFKKTILFKSWFNNSTTLIDIKSFYYFRNYMKSSDFILEFLSLNILQKIDNSVDLRVSQFLVLDEFQSFSKVMYHNNLLQLPLYEYYSSDPFTRVSKTLNLARQRFSPLEIYT